MSLNFEELAFVPTALGDLSLRRKRLMMLGGRDVFEVKLGDEWLMSSLFTVVEEELARRALAATTADAPDVLVGGLGLGHTAATVLDHSHVKSLLVVDALEPVIDWHRRHLVPLGERLTSDPRCDFVCSDFFASAASDTGFDPGSPGRKFDVILLDIDHAPRHLLHPRHAAFYNVTGLQHLAKHLVPEGIFAMWSDSPIDEPFLEDLNHVFDNVRADQVSFDNPFLEHESVSIIYLGRHR